MHSHGPAAVRRRRTHSRGPAAAHDAPRARAPAPPEVSRMALVDPTTFDGKEVAMIYVAGRLSEGQRVERVLSDHAIDYAVDVEPFHGSVLGIFPVEYEGVGFYVLSTEADFCRHALREAGLVQGLVEERSD
jgi:hypothetical protein